MSASDKIVAVLRKNAREEVRVGIGEFNGYALVSLRVWADASSGGERIPTKSGFNFDLSRIRTLIEALRAAESAGIEAGLIAPSVSVGPKDPTAAERQRRSRARRHVTDRDHRDGDGREAAEKAA